MSEQLQTQTAQTASTTATPSSPTATPQHPATAMVQTMLSRGERVVRAVASVMEAYPAARDVKSLKAAFVGFDVKKASISMGEGDLKDEHIAVSKGGKLAMKIYGDGAANSIEVVSDEIWNPWGLKIGMTYEEVAKIVGPFECGDAAQHTDWKQDVAECETEKTMNWAFDFESEFEAKDLIAKPDKLAKAKLVAMRWEAPSSGPPGAK